MRSTLACLLLCSCLPWAAQAQEAAPAPPGSRTVEPRVEHIVVEDKAVRIEELRVRGQTQRIVVRSKLEGVPAYEILPAQGSRDLSQTPAATRGASGQRVWNMLSF